MVEIWIKILIFAVGIFFPRNWGRFLGGGLEVFWGNWIDLESDWGGFFSDTMETGIIFLTFNSNEEKFY